MDEIVRKGEGLGGSQLGLRGAWGGSRLGIKVVGALLVAKRRSLRSHCNKNLLESKRKILHSINFRFLKAQSPARNVRVIPIQVS